QMIGAGDAQVVVAGGMESMTNARYVRKKARFGYKLGDGTLIDLMTHDGLTSSFDNRHMVEQASFVSRELGIPREDQDRWALRSHERAVQAIDEGRFEDETVPVGDFAVDEGRRRDTSSGMLAADPERVSVTGGAVALGHPIGAAGARILATMIHELHRNGGGLGLAAICSGGGQGDAMLIEV